MKKCNHCGAVQKDERSVCIDCGKVLGKSLSEAEEAAIEDRIDERLDSMAERAEDFYVPLRDKIMGVISILGIIAAIVLIIFVGKENDRIEASIPDGVIVQHGSGFTTILSDGTVDYQYPSAHKRTVDNAGESAFIALFCLAVALPMLTVPKAMWFIDTLKYRLFYNWDTTPSYFAIVVRKAATYLLFVIGVICVLYGYYLFF